MEWMFLPIKRYADFQGRSRRLEYWMFVLGMLIAITLLLTPLVFLGFLDGQSVASRGGLSFGVLAVLALFYVTILIPSIAVQVRRFHDPVGLRGTRLSPYCSCSPHPTLDEFGVTP